MLAVTKALWCCQKEQLLFAGWLNEQHCCVPGAEL